MPSLRLFLVLAVAMLPAAGQLKEFDAVSVKPAVQSEGQIEPIEQVTPGRITIRNYVAKKLVMEAYQLSWYQVDGPAWPERDRFDIIATKPPGATTDDLRVMLQHMLASRFHLAQHRETRQLQAYVLLAGRDISKLHAVTEDGIDPACGRSGTIARFAEILATILDKPVIDQTGIAGRYFFLLTWSGSPQVRDESAGGPPPAPPPLPSASPGCPSWDGKWPPMASSVFDAVKEQMGLRLERTGAAPVEVLVLDHVGKPGPN